MKKSHKISLVLLTSMALVTGCSNTKKKSNDPMTVHTNTGEKDSITVVRKNGHNSNMMFYIWYNSMLMNNNSRYYRTPTRYSQTMQKSTSSFKSYSSKNFSSGPKSVSRSGFGSSSKGSGG